MFHLKLEATEFPADLAASDPAREIVETILDLVPVSHWRFARPKGHGGYDDAVFQAAYARGPGPHIEAMRGTPSPYASGLTLRFADNRAEFAALCLFRTAELGPFASSEIRALTFALDAASELFSTLRLMDSQKPAYFSEDDRKTVGGNVVETHDSALYVLNRDLRIVLAWTPEGERCVATTSRPARLHDRLPRLLENVVRELTANWTDDVATHVSGAMRPVPFLVVRTQALTGPTGLFIGVAIERTRSALSLTHAAAHFGISPREAQVLALLLDGAHLREVATQLYITSSTVQDHIKSLLQKTGTRNRSEMIARVLRWR